MSEDLGAVLEAPEVNDEVVDDQIADDGAEAPVEGAEATALEVEVKGDERTIPAWIRALKGTDPLAFKAEKAKFFRDKDILDAAKDFDLKGTKGWLEEHGGREAIVASLGELQGKAAELDGIMSKIENGDPSLISDLSPETVAKLGPAMASQWAQADPEGWGAAMSGVFAATIEQNRIPLFLERMGDKIEMGKLDEAASMLAQLKGWANGFGEKAAAPRTQQPGKDDRTALEQERQQFYATKAQEEKDAFGGKIRDEADATIRTPTITKELDSFFKRRPNDNDAKDLAISTVKAQVRERMINDADYQKQLTAFTDRKDRAGALKLLKSREEAAIKDIAPKVGRTIFGNPGPAKVEAAKVAPITRSAAPKAAVDPRDAILQRAFQR